MCPDRAPLSSVGVCLRPFPATVHQVSVRRFAPEHSVFGAGQIAQRSHCKWPAGFEQLKGNELLEAIHEAIVSALEGVPVKAAAISAPSATVLLQYCKRLAAGPTDPVALARSVTEKPPLEKGAAPPKPVPLEQVFAENDRIIILGEGGLGKTKALQRRERDLAEQYGRGAGCPVPVYVRLADYHGGEIENLVAERVNRVPDRIWEAIG
jgi:hypothetical protein